MRLILNSAIVAMQGSMSDWIYKHYSYGTVVTRRPRMEKVVWSPAQIAHRKTVRAAANFYLDLKKDPVRAAPFRARAAEQRISLPSLVLREFIQARKAGLDAPA
jgi:hypothetical protein